MRPHLPAPSATLGSILDELTGPFPADPYDRILSQPHLRQHLLAQTCARLQQTYPWSSDLAGEFESFSEAYREQLWRVYVESAMYWCLEEMVQQRLDLHGLR